MKAIPNVWQRHPGAARSFAVALLALLTVLAATVLYQNDYDPWTIVGLLVVSAVTARWILERAWRRH